MCTRYNFCFISNLIKITQCFCINFEETRYREKFSIVMIKEKTESPVYINYFHSKANLNKTKQLNVLNRTND